MILILSVAILTQAAASLSILINNSSAMQKAAAHKAKADAKADAKAAKDAKVKAKANAKTKAKADGKYGAAVILAAKAADAKAAKARVANQKAAATAAKKAGKPCGYLPEGEESGLCTATTQGWEHAGDDDDDDDDDDAPLSVFLVFS